MKIIAFISSLRYERMDKEATVVGSFPVSFQSCPTLGFGIRGGGSPVFVRSGMAKK